MIPPPEIPSPTILIPCVFQPRIMLAETVELYVELNDNPYAPEFTYVSVPVNTQL